MGVGLDCIRGSEDCEVRHIVLEESELILVDYSND